MQGNENNIGKEDMEIGDEGETTELDIDLQGGNYDNKSDISKIDFEEENNDADYDDEDDFDFAPLEEGNTANADENITDDDDTKSFNIKKFNIKNKIVDFFKRLILPLSITVGVIVLAFIALFIYSTVRIDDSKIMKNVYIEYVDVGGLNYEDALEKVKSSYLIDEVKLTLNSQGQTFEINGVDIGMTLVPENTVQKAFDYCKSDSKFRNGIASMLLLVKSHIIMPSTEIDTERLDEKLNEFGNAVLGERRQHYVEYNEDDETVTIYSGNTGYDLNPSNAREQVLASLENENFNNILVNFTAAPPDVMTVESLDALVYKDPIDAYYDVHDNEVGLIAAVNGRYIDKEEAATVVGNVFEGCEPVTMKYYVAYPAITADELEEKLFSATLGSYSTSYGGSTSNRASNVARAASLINGTILAPGDVFSFNDTVGKRTVENGFKTASEYANGQTVQGIGGGTCQVSSTLYSATLYADMQIVDRLNHMMAVGYIPLGQDATVSDSGVDFKFKNSSDYPVKISAYTSGGTITVQIIGTDWEPHREVKISSSTSSIGGNTVVYSTRYVYADGELLSKDSLGTSTYMPHS